jgi:hypothetical protein
MGDEAWNTVKRTGGFTPLKPPQEKPSNDGYTISGVLAAIAKKPGSVQVTARFNIWVDGAMSTVSTFEGKATANGSMTAEDALRAVTESRVKMALDAIKAGRVKKLG